MAYWKDKVALITGGSKGLGLEIARALVENGAKVVITARNQEELAAAAATLSAKDQTAGWLPADVTQAPEVAVLIGEVIRLHGRIDLVVNCVGRSARGAVTELSTERFRELLETNFLSAVTVTQAAAGASPAASGVP